MAYHADLVRQYGIQILPNSRVLVYYKALFLIYAMPKLLLQGNENTDPVTMSPLHSIKYPGEWFNAFSSILVDANRARLIIAGATGAYCIHVPYDLDREPSLSCPVEWHEAQLGRYICVGFSRSLTIRDDSSVALWTYGSTDGLAGHATMRVGKLSDKFKPNVPLLMDEQTGRVVQNHPPTAIVSDFTLYPTINAV